MSRATSCMPRRRRPLALRKWATLGWSHPNATKHGLSTLPPGDRKSTCFRVIDVIGVWRKGINLCLREFFTMMSFLNTTRKARRGLATNYTPRACLRPNPRTRPHATRDADRDHLPLEAALAVCVNSAVTLRLRPGSPTQTPLTQTSPKRHEAGRMEDRVGG